MLFWGNSFPVCPEQNVTLWLVYLRAVGGESASPATLAPKVGPLGMVRVLNGWNDVLGPQEGWWRYPEGYYGLEGSEDHRQADCRQPSGYCNGWMCVINLQVEVVPSASSLIIRELAEPPRDRKKDKNSREWVEMNDH